jgi:hypothetical protein
VGVDKKTIASYLRIIEQAFIIFRLGPSCVAMSAACGRTSSSPSA